ncbi:MAG: hypothetical protein L0Z62_36205 [Gemmataceae bacterium]|nr:hypothetical protein [Gemmataceae bacterium]
MLVYDRAGGQGQLLLPPGAERIRTRAFNYRRREPTTCVVLDPGVGREQDLQFLRAIRGALGQSVLVHVFPEGLLPPTAETFDGVDLLVLVSRGLANDPPAQLALCRWLQNGGRVWVMLDRADPGVAARLLGDGFQIVDRTSLTAVQIQGRTAETLGTAQEFEEPVEFVRVLPGPEDTVVLTALGWPAAFTRPIGRGQILVTTLGAKAWLRPRGAADLRSPFKEFPNLPIPLRSLTELLMKLQPVPEAKSFPVREFLPLVNDEIGYAVVQRSTAAAIFGGFVLALLALGIGLRRSRRPELVGWLGPAAALAVAAVFVALGEASRQAAPPTVAVAQRIDVVPGGVEQPVTGLLAQYRPDAGTLPISSANGGRLEMDAAGLAGQTRRLVTTDLGAWHWEDFALPVGVRTGTFRFTARLSGPPTAVARFGPGGLEGKLSSGSLRHVTDPLITTLTRRTVAVRLGLDGSFTAGDDSLLPPGRYLADALLSDQQQRREAVYHALLTEAGASHVDGRSMLWVWAEPLDVPFRLLPGARFAGSALLTVPLELEPTPPGTRVTIPRAFIAYERLYKGGSTRPTLQSQAAVDMDLRFQLPPVVLPLQVEQARLFVKVVAPGRRFTVSGQAAGERVELRSVDSPADAFTVNLTAERFLRLDDRGGLHLNVTVGDAAAGAGPGHESGWTIESLELGVTGQKSEY